MFKVTLFCLCLCLPLTAHAKLYKVITEDGRTVFTDTAPSIDAKEHNLKPITSISNPLFNMNKINMTIPYVDEGGGMVVQGTINGIAMRFIVDTGATLLAIPPAIAKQAGLLDIPSQKVSVQTANGEVTASKVSIASVVIAKVTQSEVAAIIQEVSTKEPNLGLLGMSFFGQYKMTIDRNKKEIQLGPK